MDEYEYRTAVLVELQRIRFRAGVCALIMGLPFLLAGLGLALFLLGAVASVK